VVVIRRTRIPATQLRRQLLHDKPHQRCRVWLWNGEDPIDELRRRIAAVVLHYRIPPTELDGWLFVDSGRTSPIIIAQGHRDGVKIAVPVKNELIATIRANKIDVVKIDPFVSCHAVSENDNVAIDAVVKTYSQIADVTDGAFELTHHSRKTGGEDVDAEHARGASALLGAVRSARTLNAMSKDEAAKAGVSERHRYVRVDDGKANLAPRSDVATWLKMESMHLGNGSRFADPGDSVGVFVKWHWPNPMDGMTADKMTAVVAAVAAGRWRENMQAQDWVGKPIGDALGLDVSQKADKARVQAIVRQLIGAGVLVVVTGKDTKGNERSFVEVGKAERQPIIDPHSTP